jgi:acyl carrier protein
VGSGVSLIIASLTDRFFTYGKGRGIMYNHNKPTITEIVYDYILNNHAVVVDIVDASMSLANLNLDSLEKISLAMDLEEHFEIDMSNQQIENFVTVGDIIDHIRQVLDTQPSLEELADMQRLDISALESEVNDS